MNETEVTIEAILAVPDVDDRSAGIAAKLQAIVSELGADADTNLRVEHWQSLPQRGSVQRVFLTSIGLVGLTRSSVSSFSKVMNEVAAVFANTAGANELTVEIGDRIFPLSTVTADMIESWLPQLAP